MEIKETEMFPAPLRDAIAHLWSMRFKEAEEILGTRSVTPDPSTWLYGALYAQVSWTKAMLSEDKDEAAVAFTRFEKAKEHLKHAKEWKSPPLKYTPVQQAFVLLGKGLAARMTLFEAMLKFKLEQKVKGAFSFRKSWKYYQAAQAYLDGLSKDVPYYEELCSLVEVGMGVFLFLISIVPKEWMWLVETIGFEGNRERGLQLVLQNSQRKTVMSTEALFHQIWIRGFFFEQFEDSEAAFNELKKRFPNCGQIKLMMMYLYRKWGKMDLALQLLEEARVDAKQAPQFLISLEYERALMHFLSAEWPQVIELLVPFQTRNTIVGYKTYSCYMLGLANEMLFQHEKAIENFKKVTELARKGYDYDEFADRRARKYLAAKGMRLFERKFFTAMLHSESSRFADVLDTLEGAQGVAETPEDNACIACLRGLAQFKLHDVATARKSYEEALAAEKHIKAETWVVPHSLLGMGDVFAAQKQWDEAEKYYKKAKGFSGYDFSQLSQWRAMRSLDKVAEGRKAK